MLKVDYMHLAENVIIDQKGRGSIINIFGRLDIPKVPATLQNLKVTAGIRAVDEPFVDEPLKIKLVMHGPSQAVTLVDLTQKHPIEVGYSFNPVFDINGLTFPKFGDYLFELYVNGEKLADSLLMVKDSAELAEE